MTTTNSPGAGKKVDVHISKATGGAYADVREVVEDELERIKSERSPEAQSQEGITGYWTAIYNSGRCSVCFSRSGSRATDGRLLRLAFGYDVIRLCEACAVAMRELLIDALEDEEA